MDRSMEKKKIQEETYTLSISISCLSYYVIVLQDVNIGWNWESVQGISPNYFSHVYINLQLSQNYKFSFKRQ